MKRKRTRLSLATVNGSLMAIHYSFAQEIKHPIFTCAKCIIADDRIIWANR